MNWFLSEDGSKEWEIVSKLAESKSEAANLEIAKYVLEVQRLTMTLPMIRVVQKDTTLDKYEDLDGKNRTFAKLDPQPFKEGDILILDMVKFRTRL